MLLGSAMGQHSLLHVQHGVIYVGVLVHMMIEHVYHVRTVKNVRRRAGPVPRLRIADAHFHRLEEATKQCVLAARLTDGLRPLNK